MIYIKSPMKKFTLLTMAILLTLVSYSQTTELSQLWKVKASFYKAESKSIQNLSIFELEGNYKIKRTLEIGLFTGYGKSNWLGYSNIYQNIVNVGINTNFQLLPIFIKANNLKPEIYVLFKIGYAYTNTNASTYSDINKSQMIWGSFLGFAYHFGKHIGLFVEPGIQKLNEIEFKTHVGLSYKF